MGRAEPHQRVTTGALGGDSWSRWRARVRRHTRRNEPGSRETAIKRAKKVAGSPRLAAHPGVCWAAGSCAGTWENRVQCFFSVCVLSFLASLTHDLSGGKTASQNKTTQIISPSCSSRNHGTRTYLLILQRAESSPPAMVAPLRSPWISLAGLMLREALHCELQHDWKEGSAQRCNIQGPNLIFLQKNPLSLSSGIVMTMG